MQITTKTLSILLRRIDFSCIDVFGLAYCQPNFELFSPGRCWGALKYLHAAGPYPVANLPQFADPTTTTSFRLDSGLDYWLAKPLHWFFFSANNVCIDFARWQGALSCWNIAAFRRGTRFGMFGNKVSFKMSAYSYWLRHPSNILK